MLVAKKPYSAPQLVQVALNHEQAILTQCSLAGASTSNGGNPGRCRVTNPCKRRSTTVVNATVNSAGRPS